MSRPSTAALLFIRRSVINAATRTRTATALLSPLLQQQKQQQQLSDTSCLTTTTASTAIPATRFFSSSNSSNSSSSMGVTKEVIEEGYGPTPTKGQTVTVHCTGYGKNNDLAQKFWSTKDPGQDVFQFQVGVGAVIKGWDEGVLGMQQGERSKLTCTPEYAYGASGFSAWGILPNATLVFEIELLDFH